MVIIISLTTLAKGKNEGREGRREEGREEDRKEIQCSIFSTEW